jgi:hypothetical protein
MFDRILTRWTGPERSSGRRLEEFVRRKVREYLAKE